MINNATAGQRRMVKSRRGVIGELLVIVALLASMTLLVITFTNQQDVPNVKKESVNVLTDIHDVIARAIVDWLNADPMKQPLACNGVYTLPGIERLLTTSLEPYVTGAVNSKQFENGKLKAIPGALQDVQFAGMEGLTVTLANGSIVYDDGSIYAADNFSKQYFFNVRLPLALGVVKDWLMCDAGNLSGNLAVQYGKECFYGKKDPLYPGVCANNSRPQAITEEDRRYIFAHGISEEHVARAVQESIGELNDYFDGKSSCEQPTLSGSSGITCSYDLTELNIQNQMTPWKSDQLPGKWVNGQLEYMKDDILDTGAFWNQDQHVYLLPADTAVAPYNDAELRCDPNNRTPAHLSIGTAPIPADVPLLDVLTDPYTQQVKPVLYVNVTRGATFALRITCKDDQASLLGQPLIYRFSIKYGVKEHCGPSLLKNVTPIACANPNPCTSDAWCGIRDCKKMKCDTESGDCVATDEIAEGASCDNYGCFRCDANADCKFDSAASCSAGDTTCATYQCQESPAGCVVKDKINQGGDCTPSYMQCDTMTCQQGTCAHKDYTSGPCTSPNGCPSICDTGMCVQIDQTCGVGGGGGECKSPCYRNGEGNCVDSSGNAC
jgi:hypothetical protein